MKLRTPRLHDASWLRMNNDIVVHEFLARFAISDKGPESLLFQITDAFKQIPFENLTKIIKADSVVSARSAKRSPDELIGDYLRFGTGGTCFSLTAATVAMLDAVGIDAYPVLADRHYGLDTHCGLIIVRPDARLLILDPGFLLFSPVVVPTDGPVSMETGFNRVELVPIAGGSKIELYTTVKGNRKLRLTFKIDPVSDEAFGKFWERSFEFEMMNYPVLTRCVNGAHHYLQDNVLAIRDAHRTKRTVLTPEMQIDFLSGSVNIHRSIVTQALEIVKNGSAPKPTSR
jgi:hypothetical protein